MKKVLIIGATSAIAEATARLFAKRGDRLFLLARNEEKLAVIAQDLKIRGAESVLAGKFDALSIDRHNVILDQAIEQLEGIDLVLIAHGTLPDQKVCEASIEKTITALNINALSVISLLSHLANTFAKQGSGSIAVISSVAGERGRQSNYIYGAAKGAVSIFLQGLRHRLHKSGVHVLTIKPGFVDTPMTAELPKGPLWAQPDQVARSIFNAIEKKKSVVYTPGFWAFIMLIVRLVPNWIFHKTKL